MTKQEIDALVDAVSAVVLDRLVALERRWESRAALMEVKLTDAERTLAAPGPAGPQGPQGDRGEAGESFDVREFKDALAEAQSPVLAHVASLVTRIADLEARAPVPGPVGATGEKGDPGERGANGLNGTNGSDGIHGKDGADGRHGKDGADGRHGIGITAALIDKDGQLVLTMTDGTVHKVGVVVGRTGDMGQKGADGTNGRDGIDGLGFDDMTWEYDGDRTLTVKWQRGEVVKTFPICAPWTIYRGIYQEGQTYERGDSVTYGGSQWIAKQDTTAKPGLATEDSRAWQLAVKVGREGKVGPQGPAGKDGANGRNGRDLTVLGPDGQKW